MVNCEVKISMDFERALRQLGANIADIEERMLQEGGKVLVEATKQELRAVIGDGLKKPSRSTGELESSVGVTRHAFTDRDGNPYVKIGFNEPRRKGNTKISNGRLAAIIEYGQHGQPARPFMKRASKRSKSDVESAMKRVFDEEVAKYDGTS